MTAAMQKFEILYATTAEQSLYSQISHLEPHHGYAGANERLSRLIQDIEARLSEHPLAYPVSSQASLLGIIRWRELNLDDYRVLYECDENIKRVIVALILRQRQSVESQLIHYCLMFDR